MGFTNCSVGESRTWSPEDVWCQLTSYAVESHQFTSTRAHRSIRHCPSVILRMRRLHATTTPATKSGDRSTRCNKCCCPRFRNRKNLAGKPARLYSVKRRCGTAGTSAQCHHRECDRGTGIRGKYVRLGRKTADWCLSRHGDFRQSISACFIKNTMCPSCLHCLTRCQMIRRHSENNRKHSTETGLLPERWSATEFQPTHRYAWIQFAAARTRRRTRNIPSVSSGSSSHVAGSSRSSRMSCGRRIVL